MTSNDPISRTIAVFATLCCLLPGCSAEDASPTESPASADPDALDPSAPSDDADVPAEEPPSNASVTDITSAVAPTSLGLLSYNSTDSASGAEIKLSYINRIGTFACTLQGLGTNQRKDCTPTKESDQTSADHDFFKVSFTDTKNSDGLRFTSTYVTVAGIDYHVDTFTQVLLKGAHCVSCGTTTLGKCGSCWVDAWSKSTTCVSLRIQMDGPHDTICLAKSGLTSSSN